MLRAPEVILRAGWNSKVDIWNFGLVVSQAFRDDECCPKLTWATLKIWELAEGSLVFDGTWTSTAPYTAEAHLAQMEAVLGGMPKSLLARSRDRDRFFDHNGE